jgi:UDP-N-acetylmuramate: L-alanyl-gamma-D-glutamyl-meso-diaminopimelate ligase
LVLTGADWEHKESYATAADNLTAYKKLVQKIPKDGLLVYNPNGKDIKQLLPFCQSKKIPYDSNLNFSNNLIGKHNHENIVAAYTLCRSLGISDIIIQQAIKTYLGVKRRLELVSKINNTYFIDDFAQSPQRVQSTLRAIKDYFPNHKIKVYFEPHASFLQHKSGISGFKSAFFFASDVVISKINYNHNPDKNTRTTAKDFITEIGSICYYEPLDNLIAQHFSETLKSGDILVHFSSGGLDGLKNFHQIIKIYKN